MSYVYKIDFPEVVFLFFLKKPRKTYN